MTGESNNFKDPIEIKGDGLPLSLFIGTSIGSVVFVIIVAVILFFIWKKRNPPVTKAVRLEKGQGISPKFLSSYSSYTVAENLKTSLL